MSTPYTAAFEVFPAATALTATKTIGKGLTINADVDWGGHVQFQYVGAAFSGTLAFNGRPNASAAWVALPYMVLGALPTVTSDTITQTTDSSTVTYVVLVPMPEMQVVMTRSAGSLTMEGRLFEHPLYSVVSGSTSGPPSAAAGSASSQYQMPYTEVTAAVIKASTGNVLHFYATNNNAAARFIQLHNKATIPLATEVPLRAWRIPAGTANAPGYVEFTYSYGDNFTTGIGFAVSTTRGTFTDSATASEHDFHLEYV